MNCSVAGCSKLDSPQKSSYMSSTVRMLAAVLKAATVNQDQCCTAELASMSVGDFVDRGAWGLEVLLLLACWKLVYPKQVIILRGNHECTTCTHMYGFRSEVLAKYGQKAFQVGLHEPLPAVIKLSALLSSCVLGIGCYTHHGPAMRLWNVLEECCTCRASSRLARSSLVLYPWLLSLLDRRWYCMEVCILTTFPMALRPVC